MAAGDPYSYYHSHKYNSPGGSNYLKHLNEEREKTKKSKMKKEEEQQSWQLSYGGALTTSNSLGNITLGSPISGPTTISGNAATFIGYNTTSNYNGYYYPSVITTDGSFTVTTSGSYGSYIVNMPVPMLFENEIIKIKEGKVYINDKLEMNPTRIGLALLKALEGVRKDDLNDAKDMFNKD